MWCTVIYYQMGLSAYEQKFIWIWVVTSYKYSLFMGLYQLCSVSSEHSAIDRKKQLTNHNASFVQVTGMKICALFCCQLFPAPVGMIHKLSDWNQCQIPAHVTLALLQCLGREHPVAKMLSYRRETALQGALYFWPKVEDWNWKTIFYGHYRSIFNHCDMIGLKIYRIRRKKTENKGSSYGVQSHSRSSRSVPFESTYAISY